MSTQPDGTVVAAARPARPTSWAMATWVAPVVPTLTLWLLVLVDSGTDVASEETRGYLTAVGCAVALGLVGALMTRARAPRRRGLGLGVVAGAAVTVVVLLALVAS